MASVLLDQFKTTALSDERAKRLRFVIRNLSLTKAAELLGASPTLVEKLDGGKTKAESVERVGALLDAKKCAACFRAEREKCEHWPGGER